MSLTTSTQIKNKSVLIKAVIENLLTDITENKTMTLRDIDRNDLKRAMESCDEIIDLSKYLTQAVKDIQKLSV